MNMIAALLLLGIQYASYQVPLADRALPVMQYGYQESTTFAPNTQIVLPPFDTTLGTLVDVQIIFNVTPTWGYRAENPNVNPTTTIQWFRSFEVNVVYRPSFAGPVEFDPRNTVGDFGASFGAPGQFPAIGAFDGVIDYGGASGFGTIYGGSGVYTAVMSTHANSPLELWYFSLPGPKTFYVSPRMLTQTTSGFPGHWLSESDIRVNLSSEVAVLYTYQ